jgi:hypothetical protein
VFLDDAARTYRWHDVWDGMQNMMAKMMQGGEKQESMMPEMMLKGMMPHCIKMMIPTIAKDKRADIVTLCGALHREPTASTS